MTAEQIVRALAAADPMALAAGTWGRACGLCDTYERASATGTLAVVHHALNCPWRLAVEWVARTAEGQR